MLKCHLKIYADFWEAIFKEDTFASEESFLNIKNGEIIIEKTDDIKKIFDPEIRKVGEYMKLSRVQIKNFKSLREIDIQLNDDVNLLIGENNSGKSNLIEALRFLPTIIGGNVNREKFENIISHRNIQNSLAYELIFVLSDEEKLQFLSNFNFSEEEKSEFSRRLKSNIKYTIIFGIEELGIEIKDEQACIYLKDREIILSKGIREGNGYHYHILEDFETVARDIDSIPSNDLTKRKGGSSPARSILTCQYNKNPRPEEHLLVLILNYLNNIEYLLPSRISTERGSVRGDFRLFINGSNLPQVLNSFASSDKTCFEKIIEDVKFITNSVLEIEAPLIPNTQNTYLAIKEKHFEDIEFTWDNISSGVKEIIFLVTFLNSTEKGSLLFIEEPEIHLHGNALRRFFTVMKEIIEEDGKQIIIATHSPTFIDLVDQEKLLCVIRENGWTNIIPLSQESDFVGTLRKAGLTMSDILISLVPSFLLIVEGRDDYRIFDGFLRKEGIDCKENRIKIIPSSNTGGVIKFGKVLKRLNTGIPFLLISDSDRKRDEKEQEMKNEGFREKEYLILEKGEIEDYLIDSDAIAKALRKPRDETEEIVSRASGTGKKKLESILKELNYPSEGGIKKLIAQSLESTPPEIKERIESIKNDLRL